PARQPEQRHDTGHDQEDQFQAHKPKIISPPDGPANAEGLTKPTAFRRASAQAAQVFGTYRSGSLLRRLAEATSVSRTMMLTACRRGGMRTGQRGTHRVPHPTPTRRGRPDRRPR